MNFLFFLPHYPSFCWSGIFGIILDHAELMAENKDRHVTVIYCDTYETVGKCYHIHTHPKHTCRLCNFHKQYLLKKISRRIHLLPLSELSKEIKKESMPSFSYNSVEEIKKLSYKNVDIGYAAFSTYLSSVVRNLNPLIDDSFRTFFDQFLERCCNFADIVDFTLDKLSPDQVFLFNARFIDSKPIVDICTNRKIPFTSLEHRMILGNQPRKTFFENTTPHDIENTTRLIKKQWDIPNTSEEEKIQIASIFYTNRKNAIAAGDKVFVKNQQFGLLPDNWDEHKHNIVIFNSSEDEFASIGKAYEAKQLFPTQLDGLKTIFEVFKDHSEIHFYLRVHPNLMHVKYLYHYIIYEFEKLYPNLTVISADSSISTYSLIDAANKVMVFGSTTGAESVFWGKPTILLNNSAYKYLDICYTPQNMEEVKDLILNFNLPAKNKLGALQFAYYYLNTDDGEFSLFKVTNRVYHFFKRPVRIQYFDIKGSKFSKYRTFLSQFFCKLIYDFMPKERVPTKEDEKTYEKYLQ